MVPLALLVLLAGALLAPGLLIGPSLDAAVFSHVGGRLLDGVPPYVGAWDHKPPGMYLASAGAQALLGWLGPWTAEWLLSVAATTGIGVAVAVALKRLEIGGWSRTLACAGAVVLAGQYLLALGGGLTEPLATGVLGGAAMLVLASADRMPRGRFLLLGSLAGVALLVSLQLAPGAAALVALAVAASAPRLRVAAAGWTLLGLAAPTAAATLWLAVIGALPAAVDAVVTYASAYRSANAGYGGALSGPVVSWTLLSLLYLVAPAAMGAASALRRSGPRRAVALAALGWIAGTAILSAVQGRFLAHYAIPLAVPLGILAGIGMQRAARAFGRQPTATGRTIVLLPLVASLAISVAAGIVAAAMEAAPLADRAARMQAVAERLGDLPDGTLLVWGNEPRLYDLADRDPATRYSYLYPLTTPGYSTAAMIDDVARTLAANPPAAVVDAGSSVPGQPGFLPLLLPRPVTTDGRDLDLLDPLRDFVAGHYELVTVVRGWPIYRLRSAGMKEDG